MNSKMANPHLNWSVPADWVGETIFIVAGGLSVERQNLGLLRDRRVIAINSSYEKVPWAPYLFTMDGRWLRYHEHHLRHFAGKVVTNSASAFWKGMLALNRISPPGLSMEPNSVSGLRTSLHGAINMAIHLNGATRDLPGPRKIVVLGADGGGVQYAGRTHHHSAHPWYHKKNCWEEQLADLKTIVEPLRDLKVTVLNCSPGTAWPIWPIVDKLEDCLR